MPFRADLAAALAASLFLAPVVAFSAPAAPSPRRKHPLVVEAMPSKGGAERAGLRVGDELLGWRREVGADAPAAGTFETPMDVEWVGDEQARRGLVRLVVRRSGKVLELAPAEDGWIFRGRPPFGKREQRILGAGRAAEGPAAPERQRLARMAMSVPGGDGGYYLRVAAGLEPERSLAELWFDLAAEKVRSLPRDLASVEDSRADWYRDHDFEAECRVAYLRAIGLLRASAPDSLVLAGVLDDLGTVEAIGGHLDRAIPLIEESIAIEDRIGDPEQESSGIRNNFAIALRGLGDFRRAISCAERAFEDAGRRDPDSLSHAYACDTLATLRKATGDSVEAERLYRMELSIKQRADPDGVEPALARNNLGLFLLEKGALAEAEELLLLAMPVLEAAGPDSLDASLIYSNLGVIAEERGEYDSAEGWLRKRLAIVRRLQPGGIEEAGTLSDLGIAEWRRGEPAEAEASFRRALELQEHAAPGGVPTGGTLVNLSGLLRSTGDHEEAARLAARALEHFRRLSEDALPYAAALDAAGELDADRGELREAEVRLRRAGEIRARLAPGSSDLADSLGHLGAAVRKLGRLDEARKILESAVDALEGQQQRLGGSPENLATFRERHRAIYSDLASLLVEMGCPGPALRVFESARARALLAMLAERDVTDRTVPAELERARREANATEQEAFSALSSAGTEGERLAAHEQLRKAEKRQLEVRAQLREAVPALSALRYPEPLGEAEIRALLPERSVLLSYWLDDDRSLLVAADRNRLRCWPIPFGRAELRRRIGRLRSLVGDPSEDRRLLNAELARLSEVLLGPAAELLRGADRMIVVPDGPLWLLPFALLPDPPGTSTAEPRAVSIVASATVLGELVRNERGGAIRNFAAIADPVYPAGPIAALRGETLAPLPGTRREAERIAGLLSEQTVRKRLLLGADATEANVKAFGRTGAHGAGSLHFAAHGWVDEARPLESAILLTPPTKITGTADDGVLSAWEIFEGVRFDADLVVLSACATGLGREQAGEGIVGLTRAFQYAGARSVVSSLWNVSDESTAELMVRFYAGLEAGLPRDRALRRAQAELAGQVIDAAGSPLDATHPFHWAAFQLYGDFR